MECIIYQSSMEPLEYVIRVPHICLAAYTPESILHSFIIVIVIIICPLHRNLKESIKCNLEVRIKNRSRIKKKRSGL